MPWINGRFYANPQFGRALERTRIANSARVWSEEYPESAQQSSQHPNPPNGSHAPAAGHFSGKEHAAQRNANERKASAGYGETAGLVPQEKPTARKGSVYDRSAWDANSFAQLQESRRHIMDISERNPRVARAKPGKNAGPIEQSVWNDNTEAAKESDGTLPGNHFFIRQAGVGPQKPPKSAGFGQAGSPIRSYGPFVNVGGGDVPKGSHAYIDIYAR